jgi:hypothetical protein
VLRVSWKKGIPIFEVRGWQFGEDQVWAFTHRKSR